MAKMEKYDTAYSAEPDEEQRQAFRNGDPQAMEGLCQRFLPDLYRYALAITDEVELASEAVQEICLRILESHALYVPARPFRPWLFTIARNTCHSLLRRRTAQQAHVFELEPSSEQIERMASQAPTALEQALRFETDAGLWKALAQLPEIAREIITLHIFEEISFRQIAEMTDSSPNTVASHYYRGLQRLKDLLQKAHDTPDPLKRHPERRLGRAI